jgi:hypothetical protein
MPSTSVSVEPTKPPEPQKVVPEHVASEIVVPQPVTPERVVTDQVVREPAPQEPVIRERIVPGRGAPARVVQEPSSVTGTQLTPSQKPQVKTSEPERTSTPEQSTLLTKEPISTLKPPTAAPPSKHTSSDSTDSLSKVKQMAKQFDEDSGLGKKKNNFIANAKAKYSVERRKRTISNDSDLMSFRPRTESPDPEKIAQSKITGLRSASTGSVASRHPSLFDIATSRFASSEHVGLPDKPVEPAFTNIATSLKKDELSVTNNLPGKFGSTATPESISQRNMKSKNVSEKDAASTLKIESKVIPSPEPSPSLKPFDHSTRQASPVPLVVAIPSDPVAFIPSKDTSSSTATPTITPTRNLTSPVPGRVQRDVEYLESPILGDALLSSTLPVFELEPESVFTSSSQEKTSSITTLGALQTIPEEIPALNIIKKDSIPDLDVIKAESPDEPAPVVDEDLLSHYIDETDPHDDTNGDTAPQTREVEKQSLPLISSPPSSSASSKVAEPSSSYEDLGGISMDDQEDHMREDAGSDTSVEAMEETKPLSPIVTTSKPNIIIPDANPPSPPATSSPGSENASPITIKSSSSRASRIWLEKNGTNIHTEIAEYLSDGDDPTPPTVLESVAPLQTALKESKILSEEDSSSDRTSSPTPYKDSLTDYEVFRGLGKKMAGMIQIHLDVLLATKLTQHNLCKAVFGYENIKQLIQEELKYARKYNSGLTELVLKLWLGLDIDDETLLKAILFGKSNGLSDALVLSVAPLGIFSR